MAGEQRPLSTATGGPGGGWLANPWGTLVARLIVGLVFVFAAEGKLTDPLTFTQDIENYRIISGSLAEATAVLLPGIELVAGLLLLLGVWYRGAALVIGGMLGVFTVFIVAAVLRHIDISCGCFGGEAAMAAGWLSVVRNLGLLACVVVVLVGERGELTVPGWWRRRSRA